MAIAYCIIFSLTLSTVLNAFLKDTEADRGIEAWIFIFLAAFLWPITLPFIISSKLRAYQESARKRTAENPVQSSATHHSQEALP